MENPVIVHPSDRAAASTDPLELLGQSAAAARLREFVRRAAAIDGSVLIAAEDGVAVDSIARALHDRGRHTSGPFVQVDCAASDAPGIDGVLFGVVDDAEASDLEAVSAESAIASARGGLLYLRHVAELPAAAQARLARVVRDGEVRVGGARLETGFRLVASATPAIDADVDARRFRTDLYRRLSAVRIDVPSLRERADDVPALAERLLEDVCASRGTPRWRFTQAALALIAAWSWPGNLRELHAALDRVVAERAEGSDAPIQIEDLLPALRLPRGAESFEPAGSLREARLRFERDYIASVLQHHGWHMAHAAETLGIQRPNLYRKARQLGIPLSRAAE